MRYFFVILFLTIFIHLSAQENALQATSLPSNNSFHLKLGAGIGLQTFRDAAMSPLLYDGIEIGALLGAEWRRPLGFYRVDGLFWLGETSAEQTGAVTDNYTFAVNGGYLWQLHRERVSSWHCYAGAALTAWGSFREHNSLPNSNYFYDVFFSVAPTGAIEYDFRLLKQDWNISLQLTVPVLTYGLRPNFSGLDEAPPNDNGGFEKELKAAEVGSFNILTSIKSRLELAFPLQNGNRIGLLYYWDFYNANIEPHSVKQFMQSVQLNLHFRL